jgi:hypothetical protein
MYLMDMRRTDIHDFYDPASLPGLLDWIGFIIGTVGITIAVAQLWRSASALKAAKTSLDKTRSELIFNRLNAAIPELRRLTDILGGAIDTDNRDAAAFALNDFPVRVSEVKKLFLLTRGAPPEFLTGLDDRTRDLIEMRSWVYDNPSIPLSSVMGFSMTPLRALISEVSGISMDIQTTAQSTTDA